MCFTFASTTHLVLRTGGSTYSSLLPSAFLKGGIDIQSHFPTSARGHTRRGLARGQSVFQNLPLKSLQKGLSHTHSYTSAWRLFWRALANTFFFDLFFVYSFIPFKTTTIMSDYGTELLRRQLAGKEWNLVRVDIDCLVIRIPSQSYWLYAV